MRRLMPGSQLTPAVRIAARFISMICQITALCFVQRLLAVPWASRCIATPEWKNLQKMAAGEFLQPSILNPQLYDEHRH